MEEFEQDVQLPKTAVGSTKPKQQVHWA